MCITRYARGTLFPRSVVEIAPAVAGDAEKRRFYMGLGPTLGATVALGGFQ